MTNRKKFFSLILGIALILSQFTAIAYAGDELNAGNNIPESQVTVGGTDESAVTDGTDTGENDGSAVTDDTATEETTGSAVTDDTATGETTGSAVTDDTTTEETTGSAVTDDTATEETTGSAVTDDTTTGTGIETEIDTTGAAIEPLVMILMESAGTFAISEYDVNKVYETGSTFTISTKEELKIFSDLVNGEIKNTTGEAVPVDFDGDPISLKGDITLSGSWNPIGTESTPFSGTFDGNGHMIDGLNITGSDSYQGLFGYTSGGEVKDVTVSGSITSSGKYIGGIIAYADSTDITRCISNVEVSDAESYAGGIAGCATGYTTLCVNNENISGNKNFIGGIAGLNYGLILDCLNKGDVSGDNYIGGVTGKGKVKTSLSLGIFSGTGDHTAGISPEGAVTSSYSKGECTEAQLKYGYVAYQLNTSGGTAESSNRWQQGELAPELESDSQTIYKFSLKDHTEGNAVITYYNDGIPIPKEAILSGGNNTDEIYLSECNFSIKVAEIENKGEFHFSPSIFAKDPSDASYYTVRLDKNISVEAGYGELPSELADNEIKWYVEHKEETTYVLEEAKQLYGLAKLVNGTAKDSNGNVIPKVNFNGKTISLSQDIDLKEAEWTPIGYDSYNYYFGGIFDGQNHTIKGLKISDPEMHEKGFFGEINSANIKNLTVEGSITNVGDTYQDKAGGIIANASQSTIDNCVNKVQITGGGTVGGIAGNLRSSEVNTCINEASITGSETVGGIGGNITSKTNIVSCKNNAEVTGSNNTGGIAGYASSSSNIKKCINAVQVIGKATTDENGDLIKAQNTGGIVGYAYSSTVEDSTNNASVKGDDNTGGIAGYAYSSTVTGSQNNAQIDGGDYGGGIAGLAEYQAIENCYNVGNVHITGDFAGGITGDGDATNCYSNSISIQTLGEGQNLGDISGKGEAQIINCYSTGKISGKAGNNGIVLTEENLKSDYCGYIVYQLNTSGETKTNKGLWKKGTEGPELGENNIYKLSVINYSDGKVSLLFSKEGVSISTDLVFSKNGIQSIYVTRGDVTIKPEIIEPSSSDSDFVFYPEVPESGGIYTVKVENEDIILRCGYTDEIEKATGEEACIEWYTKNTTASSYTIKTADELWGLASLVNGTIQKYPAVDFYKKTINIESDIDLSSSEKSHEWTPIGTAEKPFKGTFEGKNHKISGLNINSTSDYQGLFGCTSGGAIQNFKIEGTIKGNQYIGGVAGDAQNSKITNCILTGSSTIQGNGYVGGIAGNSLASISKSICEKNIIVSASGDYVGGIVGGGTSLIDNSYCTGAVIAESSLKGGVAGTAESINGCFYYNQEHALGVAGSATTVKNSYYLSNKELQGVTGAYKTADQFTDRELVYLLDTVKGTHSKLWQIGVLYPELGQNTIYKISIAPQEIQAGKSVNFAEPGLEDRYKIYSEENGQYYSYILKDEIVKLSVSVDDETILPIFYPQNTVIKEGNVYSINKPQSDLSIMYRFTPAVEADIDWYVQNLEAKEYIINTEEQLRGLALLVNGQAHDADRKQISPVDFNGKTVKLSADVNAVGPDWVPIGTSTAPFNGIFDGGGHSVNNYIINSTVDYQGLFGYAGTAEIKNLKVNGKVNGGANVGGIAGYIGDMSTVSNCTNAGIIAGTGKNIGGIVGYIGKNGSLNGCSNNGKITGGNDSNAFVGGIAGTVMNYGTAENCSNSGTIEGKGQYTGGLFGNPYGYATIINCSNFGKVTGNGDYLGGIAGGIDSNVIEISNCFNSGEITETGNGAYKVGGITGDLGKAADSNATATYCYNEGAIKNLSVDTSDSENGTGGVFGQIGSNYGFNVHHCWNTGNVISTAANTGGVTGYINSGSSISDCYNLGDISGAAQTGGITGAAAANNAVISCFNYGGNIKGSGTDIGAIAGKNNSGKGCSYLDGITIQNEKAETVTPADTNSQKISAQNFKSFDTVYDLNTKSDTVKNRGIWTSGTPYPLYANGTEPLLHKADLSSIDQTNGKVAFSDGSTENKRYLSAGDAVSITITPNSGYIMGKYTVKNILGDNIAAQFSENESGTCTVSFTMPDIGIIVSADFVPPVAEGNYQIKFDAKGGAWNNGAESTKIIEIAANKRIDKPEDPVWGARELTGWYTDETCQTLYNFSSAVQSSFTLYAGWETYYKVSLDPNGGSWTDPAKSFIKVVPNTAAVCPEEKPIKADSDFTGWYTDQETSIPYDFKTVITGDVTLYAGWAQKGFYQIIFDANGGTLSRGGTSAERIKISVAQNSIASSPSDLGYIASKKSDGKDMTFRGWYSDPQAGSKWNFNNKVTSNKILYAHWDGDIPVIGFGTKDNPMELEDLDLLIAFRDSINTQGSAYQEGYFKLVKDLTLPKDWEPIGVTGSKFAAYFDGSGHTITVPAGGRSLFGIVQKAEIRNLTIYGKEIDGSGIIESFEDSVLIDHCTIKSGSKLKGSGFVGNLPLGKGQAVTIQNCEVESGVTVGYTKDQDYIGGIAGNVNCVIKDCVSNADVYGNNFVGGIVARKGQTMAIFEVSGCYSGGTVNGTGNYVGGIVGGGYIPSSSNAPGVSISNCYSTAKIKGGNYVGGIFGADTMSGPPSNGKPTIQNCYWYGSSIQADGEYVGGIVGYYETVNSNCILKNNYYAASDESLKGYGAINNIADTSFIPDEAFKLKPAEAFENGEVAYLLDGGQGSHSNIWTSGVEYPEFGTPSIYMIDGKTTGNGTLKLSDGKHEGETVYNSIGTAVTVSATPAEYENSKNAEKTYENTLESIVVTYGNGSAEDITASKTFTSTGNDVVTATFKLTEKIVEPEPEPEEPVDPVGPPHGGGDGDGNGNGSGSGSNSGPDKDAGDGSGQGTGDAATATGTTPTTGGDSYAQDSQNNSPLSQAEAQPDKDRPENNQTEQAPPAPAPLEEEPPEPDDSLLAEVDQPAPIIEDEPERKGLSTIQKIAIGVAAVGGMAAVGGGIAVATGAIGGHTAGGVAGGATGGANGAAGATKGGRSWRFRKRG